MVRSEWLIFGRDFTVRTIAVETVGLCIFFLVPVNFKYGRITKSKKEYALKFLLKAKCGFIWLILWSRLWSMVNVMVPNIEFH